VDENALSITEQCGMHFAMTSIAMPLYWVTADLHEEQILTGVIAVTKACC